VWGPIHRSRTIRVKQLTKIPRLVALFLNQRSLLTTDARSLPTLVLYQRSFSTNSRSLPTLVLYQRSFSTNARSLPTLVLYQRSFSTNARSLPTLVTHHQGRLTGPASYYGLVYLSALPVSARILNRSCCDRFTG
jgi:hypothetical protein